MTRRPAAAVLALTLALAAASAAVAQPTAADAPVATGPASEPSVAEQIDAYLKASPASALPDDGPDGIVGAARDGQIHGEVSVGVGTHGYRHAYVRTDIPLGETGQLSIAMQESRFDGRFGDSRFGGVRARSLGVGLSLGETASRSLQSRCREPWRAGEVWPTLHGPQDGRRDLECLTERPFAR